MISYPDKKYMALQRSTVHPLLAATMPLLFLLCVDSAARTVLPPLPFSPLAVILLLARLRELLIVLALAYAAAALIASLKSRSLVTARPDFAYPVLFVLFQWILSVSIQAALREREMLLTAIEGMRGEELLHKLRESSLQAGLSLGGLRSLKILMIAFQIQLFSILLILFALKAPVGAWTVLLFAAHAVYGAFVVGLINMYRENQLLLGEGIVVPAGFEAARVRALVGVLAACLPIVLLGSRNEAPLSLTLLSSLLDWLDRIVPRLQFTTIADSVRRYLEIQRIAQQRMLAAMTAARPDPAVLLFFEFLRRLLRSAAGAGLYFFLVSPLFSEEFVDSLARHSLTAFLRRKLSAFLRFWTGAFLLMAALLRSILEWRGREVPGPEKDRGEGARRSQGRAPSLRKRLQTDRVLKAFFLLVQWGERHGVGYLGSDTPKEYALKLAPKVPEGNNRLSLIVDVLEESVFSTHVLDSGRMAGYFAAVRLIRKTA
jgi:hypothetical protein